MATPAHELNALVTVRDEHGVRGDPALPTAAAALDPAVMAERLGALPGDVGAARLEAIRVVRHKPLKRCVIEYALRTRDGERIALLGKIRSKHTPRVAFKLMEALRAAGFDESAPDGICVPEPLARYMDLNMWLQRRVAGEVATDLLAGSSGPALAARIADADVKLQRAGARTRRDHGMRDELSILNEALGRVAVAQTALAARIDRLLDACQRRAASVRAPKPCGIHRDYYADQVIVAGPRLYLIDFDLYCSGDPALDMGNFNGHVIEQSLREHGNTCALDDVVHAGRERFLARGPADCEHALNVYTDLTLVRHVYLSTLFESRRQLTEVLLELCEARFAPWMGRLSWGLGLHLQAGGNI